MILSIITINFNNVAGLKRTLESIMSQTYKEFEYIVIDGGSTDGSMEIINIYSDKINYWVSEPDKGIYHAMNKGIKASKGKYLQFLNSGDYLVDDLVVDRMLKSMPEDCDLFIGRKISIRSDGKIQHEVQNRYLGMNTFYTSTLQHCSAYIKRELFYNYGFYDERLKIVSDWKWYMQVVGMHGAKVAFTDIETTYFDTTGISSTQKSLEKKERRMVLEEALQQNILRDYDTYSFHITQIDRLKRYKLFYLVFYFLERVLFKIDKFRAKISWKNQA